MDLQRHSVPNRQPARVSRQQRARIGSRQYGDPRPSGRMREYRNNAFAVTHPDNWEAFGDNQGAMVTIAPRSGLVQDSRGNVGRRLRRNGQLHVSAQRRPQSEPGYSGSDCTALAIESRVCRPEGVRRGRESDATLHS